MAFGVFDDDDGLVNQQPDRQRQTAERHRVQAFAGKVKPDERAETGEREREQHDEHRPETAEKNQHQQRRQNRADDGFINQVVDGFTHVKRLVHHHVEIDAFDAFENGLELRLDAFDHRNRVRAGLAVDGDIDLPLAVHAHHVQLNLTGILHARDIANVSGRALADVEREVIQFLDGRHHAVGVDLIIERAELRVARRDHDVVIADGVDDIQRRQPARRRLFRVNVSQNATELPAINGGRNDARDGLKAIPKIEVGHVVKFRFIERRTGHADETERDGRGGIKGHDHRRNRARRQIVEVAHRERRDLRHGGVWVNILAEEVLHDADADHGLGLLPRDAIGLARPAFEARGDVLLHDFRRHARIEGEDLDGRRFERRQNVRRQARNRRQADDENAERQHDDAIWVFEG